MKDIIVYSPDGLVPDVQIIACTEVDENGNAKDITVKVNGKRSHIVATLGCLITTLVQKIGKEDVMFAIKMGLVAPDVVEKICKTILEGKDVDNEDE